jgi:putative FmdB family regulatory protein
MPTYEYYCTACSKTSEIVQAITEGRKRKCPQCGVLKLKRIISAGINVLFRGSGFYVNDYKKSTSQDNKKGD